MQKPVGRFDFPEIAQKKLKSFVRRKEIKVLCIFDGNRHVYKKVADWADGKRQLFPNEIHNEIVQKLMVFISETAIIS